jgi:hypothetical protein
VATEWGGIAADCLRAIMQDSAYRENGTLVADVLENTNIFLRWLLSEGAWRN